MIDLGKWLGEGYKVEPTESEEELAPLPKTDEDEEIV
jgi:endogenous inhibitor of DNA gyrase (YacG/DUF329 family)